MLAPNNNVTSWLIHLSMYNCEILKCMSANLLQCVVHRLCSGVLQCPRWIEKKNKLHPYNVMNWNS